MMLFSPVLSPLPRWVIEAYPMPASKKSVFFRQGAFCPIQP
jgi:hypothetical protein